MADQAAVSSVRERLEMYLAENNLSMPAAPTPKGAYQPVVLADNLAYVSGNLPTKADGTLIKGRLGLLADNASFDVKRGYEACQWAALNILAALEARLGSLDRIEQIVKIVGFVQCTEDFHAQPAVLNGASELFTAVFGPGAGQAARSALGTNSLPLDSMVEVEAIVKFR